MINSCPICESAGQKELSEIYGFKYKECVKCGTVFVSNPPTEDDRSLTYQSKYYTNANKIVLANDSIIDYRLREIFIPKINFVNALRTAGAKVSDIFVVFFYSIFPNTREALDNAEIKMH